MDLMERFLTFAEQSPTAFHAAAHLAEMLRENGYEELKETDPWLVDAGGKYYVVRNDAAVIAFAVPLFLGSLIQQLYSTVDLMFVGKLIGRDASAAVGSSGLMVTCIVGFFTKDYFQETFFRGKLLFTLRSYLTY